VFDFFARSGAPKDPVLREQSRVASSIEGVMRILITSGSKHGGSQEIAQRVALTLAVAGHRVEVRSPGQVDGLDGYDAVIVGAGLYAGRWVRSARRFVERHESELRRVPVWMFSSGPLDDSARLEAIPPTAAVARLMKRVGARGHVTFGGRLAPDSKGFIARALVQQGHAGDFRDMAAISEWARGIAGELASMAPTRTAPQPAAVRPLRRALAGLCWFSGVTAVAGGVQLMLQPKGSELMSMATLAGTPFASFFVPGLLLAGIVGLANLVAGTLLVRRHRAGELATFGAGLSLTTWIVVQVLLIGGGQWLQALYFTLGLATMVGAGWLAHLRQGVLQQREHSVQPRPIRQVPTPAITS
jgi:menaquinone-dependent protoporphyrinogen oxidase